MLWHVIGCLCVIAANVHVCIRDEMWWRELEAASMVGNTTLDEYLSIDDELPSTDNAPTLNTPNQ